jgi:hypothetical protein
VVQGLSVHKDIAEVPGSVMRLWTGVPGHPKRRCAMRTKLISALLFSGALIVPGVALADQPTCGGFGTPGEVNQLINDGVLGGGQPGKVQANFGIPANEWADIRNDARKGIGFP